MLNTSKTRAAFAISSTIREKPVYIALWIRFRRRCCLDIVGILSCVPHEFSFLSLQRQSRISQACNRAPVS